MKKVEEIDFGDCFEIEIFKLNKDSSEIVEDGYRFMGWINKDGEILEDFEGSGNFSTFEDVVSYLYSYMLDVIKVNITKDNIHLYYESMSDEEKLKYIPILNSYYARCLDIWEALNVHSSRHDLFTSLLIDENNQKVYNQVFFNIIDTFKPIEEYIAEIKESVAYKEYVASLA